MRNLDEYKLATPDPYIQCEACGDYTDDFTIVTPEGHDYGFCLCHDCAKEMRRRLDESRREVEEFMEFNT